MYKGSEVECDVGHGEMCILDFCIVCFTHCLAHLVVFNTDSSTLGSAYF